MECDEYTMQELRVELLRHHHGGGVMDHEWLVAGIHWKENRTGILVAIGYGTAVYRISMAVVSSCFNEQITKKNLPQEYHGPRRF